MTDETDDAAAPEGLDVCVFTTAHDGTDSRVVEREAASLVEAGHDVTYYTPFVGNCPVERVSYGDAPEGTMLPLRTRVAAAARVAAVLYGTDYDVYHFHDAEALPTGVLLGLLTDGDVVYDVHENVRDVLRHKAIFPRPLRPVVSRVAGAAERLLSRFVDDVVVASPDLAERFADRERVTVVTNYPQRRWAEGTTPADIESDGESVQFVYRGLLSEDRGIQTLVDAVERIPASYDVSLAIGGMYDSEADRRRLEPRIEAADRVEFVEWFPSLADVIDHFRAADVATMCFHPDPNKTDAVHRSNKMFQYMAAGLPIVVSDIGNWPAVVEEADCGVAVDPEDPDAIASALVDLCDDPERRAELGRNGHRAALERYNWEREREALLSVYDRIATNGARGTPERRPAETSASAE